MVKVLRTDLTIELLKELILTGNISHNNKDINLNNKEYLNELLSYLKNKTKKYFYYLYVREFINSKRQNSKIFLSQLNEEYWTTIGYTISEAKEKISYIQRKRSFTCIEYWLNKGYSEDIAKQKLAEKQSKVSKKRFIKYSTDDIINQSVWSIQHWLNKGYSKEESILEVQKRNASCRKHYNSDSEYADYLIKCRKRSKEYAYNNPEEYLKRYKTTSKEEIEFFKFLNENIKEHNISHKSFYINLKNVLTEEQKNELKVDIGFIYDGYIKDEYNNILLIEYDGEYWHKFRNDILRDELTLNNRKDIIGILRISDNFYKNNNKEIIINNIKDGINKIKNKENNRIKL